MKNMVTLMLLLLLGCVASHPVKYDQRQEGDLNVHAHLENIVIVYISKGSGIGLKLLNLVTNKYKEAKNNPSPADERSDKGTGVIITDSPYSIKLELKDAVEKLTEEKQTSRSTDEIQSTDTRQPSAANVGIEPLTAANSPGGKNVDETSSPVRQTASSSGEEQSNTSEKSIIEENSLKEQHSEEDSKDKSSKESSEEKTSEKNTDEKKTSEKSSQENKSREKSSEEEKSSEKSSEEKSSEDSSEEKSSEESSKEKPSEESSEEKSSEESSEEKSNEKSSEEKSDENSSGEKYSNEKSSEEESSSEKTSKEKSSEKTSEEKNSEISSEEKRFNEKSSEKEKSNAGSSSSKESGEKEAHEKQQIETRVLDHADNDRLAKLRKILTAGVKPCLQVTSQGLCQPVTRENRERLERRQRQRLIDMLSTGLSPAY